MEIKGSDKPFAVIGQGSIFDGIAYWVTLAGVYLMVGGLMFDSGKGSCSTTTATHRSTSRISSRERSSTPSPEPTPHGRRSSAEFGVFVLLLASLIRLEFLPHRDKSILQVGLALAMLVFACLAFGQTATNQFEGTASLYTYFASTAIILILVSLMPPNRSDRWLGGRNTNP